MISHARRKGSNEMMLVVGAFLVTIFLLVFLVRTIDFANKPEAKAFEIANAVAANINELSAAESGSIRMDLEEEYRIGLVDNNNIWVWIKQALLPEIAEKKLLDPINQQKPLGTYVVVQPIGNHDPQYAYVASYSLYGDVRNSIPKDSLGVTQTICISKKEGALALLKAC